MIRSRYLMIAAAVALVALVSPVLEAATVNVTCTGPTTNTDGSAIPLSAVKTYKLYGGAAGQAKTVLNSKTACAFNEANVPIEVGSTWEFYVTATVANVESAASSTVTATASPPTTTSKTPNAPAATKVTVTVTVEAPKVEAPK